MLGHVGEPVIFRWPDRVTRTGRAPAQAHGMGIVTTHYTPLGETLTACELPCRAPTEDRHTTIFMVVEHVAWIGDVWIRNGYEYDRATIDPRHVDCPGCIAALPDVPACQCGAPALYGAPNAALAMEYAARRMTVPGALYCGEHVPDAYRCLACPKPLLDTSETYCGACLDPDTGDGITRDPAACGCAVAL